MDLVSCPRCGNGLFDPAAIVDGFATCTACGHRAAATYLAEQVWLERQDQLLGARLAWVREQIAAGTAPTTPAPGTAPAALTSPAGPAPTSWAAPVPRTTAGHAPAARGGVQTLLLGAGALLLVTAAAVFVTVTWDQLGPGGQLTALAVVVGLLSAGAQTARNRFRGTAETLATVAACVTVVAMLAAPGLGLVPARWHENGAFWAAVSFGITAALAVALGALSGRRSPRALISWRVAAVVGLTATAESLVIAAAGGSDVSPAGPVALAVPAAAVLRLRPGRTGRYGTDVRALGFAVGACALLDGLVAYAHLDRAGWWSLTWAVLAACAAAVAGTAGLSPARPPSTGAVTTGSDQAGPDTATSTQATSAPATAATAATPATAATATTPATARIVFAVGLGQALVLALHAAVGNPAVALPVLAVLGSALLLSTTRPGWVVPGTTAAGTVWAVGLLVSSAPNGFGHHELAAFLGILAATGYAMALLPRRGFAGWAGAAAGCLAVWIELAAAEADVPETYSFSAAGLLLLAGLLVRRHDRQASSLVVLGPALAMALLPSALLAFAEAADSGAGTLRAVLVILGGSAVAVAGALARVRAAFLAGLIATALAGLGQVFAMADVVPRWVSLGIGGVLLVATGFAAEAVRNAGRQFRVLTGRMR